MWYSKLHARHTREIKSGTPYATSAASSGQAPSGGCAPSSAPGRRGCAVFNRAYARSTGPQAESRDIACEPVLGQVRAVENGTTATARHRGMGTTPAGG